MRRRDLHQILKWSPLACGKTSGVKLGLLPAGNKPPGPITRGLNSLSSAELAPKVFPEFLGVQWVYGEIISRGIVGLGL